MTNSTEHPAISRPESIPHETGFVCCKDETIYYEASGIPELPALVFCHGLGGNHASWFQQVVELAGDFYVVTWDQRGFGRSSNSAGDVSPATAVSDLKRLLVQLRIDRVHLVGQSMGGWTALGFSLRFPAMVASLVLSDTVGGIFTPEVEAAFDGVLRESQAVPRGSPPLGTHPAVGQQLKRSDPAKAFLYQQIASLAGPPPNEIPVLLRNTRYEKQELKALRCPVLFIVGMDDSIFPPSIIASAAAQLPTSQVVQIPETGHSPYFEEPDLWNSEVRRFLAEMAQE